MKSYSWRKFRHRENLEGLWINLSEPSPSGLEMRFRGKIRQIRWRRRSLVMRVNFCSRWSGGRWTKLRESLEHNVAFDLKSSAGVTVFAKGCFRWASLDGKSCATAPTLRHLRQPSRWPSPHSVNRFVRESLKRHNTGH